VCYVDVDCNWLPKEWLIVMMVGGSEGGGRPGNRRR
jgi:hypothetical protein